MTTFEQRPRLRESTGALPAWLPTPGQPEDGLPAAAADPTRRLGEWLAAGLVHLPDAIEPVLLRHLELDIDDLLARSGTFHIAARLAGDPQEHPIRELPGAALQACRGPAPTARLLVRDFIHNSIACKEVSLHRHLTALLERALGDRVVAHSTATVVGLAAGSSFDVDLDSPALLSCVALADAAGIGTLRLRRGEAALQYVAPDGALPALHGKVHVTFYAPARTLRHHALAPDRPADRIEYPGGYVMRHPLHPREDDAFRNGVVPSRVKFRQYG